MAWSDTVAIDDYEGTFLNLSVSIVISFSEKCNPIKFYKFISFKVQISIDSHMRCSKDKMDLEDDRVYKIPCGDCDRTYIDEINRKIKEYIQEHV